MASCRCWRCRRRRPRCRHGRSPPPALRPRLEFQDVRFAYPGGRRAAHRGLSFVVDPGERVGIVGPSGSGKSSIVRLLLRLYDPQSGSVRIGGQDLRALDPEAVRRMIAVVSQDSMPVPRHGRRQSAARPARCHRGGRGRRRHRRQRARLHHGAARRLRDRDRRARRQLSGGQRQRLAIARALLRDSPILVLDEALSSVDAENEAVIQQALDRLMTGRTTLILAHRLSSVIGADRILVLEDGAVVQSGHHAELIAHRWPISRPDGAATGGTRRRVDRPTTRRRRHARARRRPTTPAPWRVRYPTRRPRSAGRKPSAPCSASSGRGGGSSAIIVLCGIARVLAFIGVGVFGALIIGAVRAHTPTLALVAALLVTAPLAGLLHWLESWLAHAMAYQLLAEMRIALFRKLDATGAGLSAAPPLRRPGRAGNAGRRNRRVFLRPHRRPGDRRRPGAGRRAAGAGLRLPGRWRSSLPPFLVYAGASPVLGRRRIDTLGSQARGALGTLGAFATETIQGLAELAAFDATDAAARGLHGGGAPLPGYPASSCWRT